MATKKKTNKKTKTTPKKEPCTFRTILDTIGGFCIAASILVMSVGMYKMIMHLIANNKLN